jgi:CheY-like chemotaxis protein
MGARTVLVVDSSPLSARRAEEALQNSGFRVVVASSQAEAEATLLQEDVAVVLSSLIFPRGNGYDLARQVKSQHPEAVVFLLCGSFEVYSQERAKAAGVQDRITRPFTADAFRRQLELVLGPLGEDAPPEVPAPAPTAPPAPAPAAPVEAVHAPVHVPDSEERLATFIPRTYQRASLPPVDPALIPVVERVVQEVLPEVVEAVLSQALHRSPAFRDLVRLTVEETVRERLPVLARSLVQQRLAELEAQVEAGESAGSSDPEGQGTAPETAPVAAEAEGTG